MIFGGKKEISFAFFFWGNEKTWRFEEKTASYICRWKWSRYGRLDKRMVSSFTSSNLLGWLRFDRWKGQVTKTNLMICSLFEGMFNYYESSALFWFNGASKENLREFNLIGVLMGLAVYNSIILDVRFPLVCYKKLLTPAFIGDQHLDLLRRPKIGIIEPTLENFRTIRPVRGKYYSNLSDFIFHLVSGNRSESPIFTRLRGKRRRRFQFNVRSKFKKTFFVVKIRQNRETFLFIRLSL